MKYRVIIQPDASREIEEAYQFIAESSPLEAARWFNRAYAAIDTLERLPRRCARAPEDHLVLQEIRQLLITPYRIIFDIQGKTVNVLHVRHGARREMNVKDL